MGDEVIFYTNKNTGTNPMDPTANLTEQRAIRERMLSDSTICVPDLNDMDRLLELSQALDEWITRGGIPAQTVGA